MQEQQTPATETSKKQPTPDPKYARSAYKEPEVPASETPKEPVLATPPEQTDKVKTEGEPEQSKEAPPQQLSEVEQAKAILKMVKENPEEFAKNFGVDSFGPRFAKLGQQAATIRRREESLKKTEAEYKQAQELMLELKQNPIGFVEKHLGKDGYKKWTQDIIARDDPNYKLINGLQEHITKLESKLEELGKPQPQAEQQQPQSTNPEQVAYYRMRANDYWKEFDQKSQKPEYEQLYKFYTKEEIAHDALELVNHFLGGSTPKWLTPEETLGMLSTEFAERTKRLVGSPQTQPQQEPTQQQQTGPVTGTLNANMRQNVARITPNEPKPSFDPISERERMRQIAAKYK